MRSLQRYLQNTGQQRGAVGRRRGGAANASPGWASQTQPGSPRTLSRWPRTPGTGERRLVMEAAPARSNFGVIVHKVIPKGSLGSTRSEWSSLCLGSLWLSQSRHLVHLLRVPSTMYNICVVAMGLCKGVALVKEIDIINYCARPIWYWTCWFLSTDIHFPYQTVPQYPFIRTAPSGAEYLLFASPSHAPSFFVRTASTGFQSFCFPLGAAHGDPPREGGAFIHLAPSLQDGHGLAVSLT